MQAYFIVRFPGTVLLQDFSINITNIIATKKGINSLEYLYLLKTSLHILFEIVFALVKTTYIKKDLTITSFYQNDHLSGEGVAKAPL